MMYHGAVMFISGTGETVALVLAAPETEGATLLATPFTAAEAAAGLILMQKGLGNAPKVSKALENAFSRSRNRDPPSTELRRPYLRKSTRDKIVANANRDARGRLLDANTGKPVKGRPDIGHKPGHEFWREKAKAEAEGLSQEQFNERMQNPDLYQVEDWRSNRSHEYERPRD